jgi:protoheme IX farnesyltransferase
MTTQADELGTLAIARSRIMDYAALAKPELTLLSVLTAVCGSYLASGPKLASVAIVHTFIGTLLVGSAAGALNQLVERQYDRLMRRTANRPLPAGRVRPGEALGLGVFAASAGIADLAVFTNILTACIAVATLATYLFLYTPLKRLTPMATLVGAIPGALPPVIGWVAVRGELSSGALALFAILFFWQMPHFLSLAWMYRSDYARAGYRMLTVADPGGASTFRHILGHSTGLFVASLLPYVFGFLTIRYAVSALILGGVFLLFILNLARKPSNSAARLIFLASLLYLPALLLSMVVGKP